MPLKNHLFWITLEVDRHTSIYRQRTDSTIRKLFQLTPGSIFSIISLIKFLLCYLFMDLAFYTFTSIFQHSYLCIYLSFWYLSIYLFIDQSSAISYSETFHKYFLGWSFKFIILKINLKIQFFLQYFECTLKIRHDDVYHFNFLI